MESHSILDLYAGAIGYIAAGLGALCAVVAGTFWGGIAKRNVKSELGRAAQFTSATFYLGAIGLFLIVATK